MLSENRPLGAVTAQNQYGEMGAFFIGESTEKRLWLTFDEGYENGYTADILDTLKEKNVKAVFFVTYDYAEKNPDLNAADKPRRCGSLMLFFQKRRLGRAACRGSSPHKRSSTVRWCSPDPVQYCRNLRA